MSQLVKLKAVVANPLVQQTTAAHALGSASNAAAAAYHHQASASVATAAAASHSQPRAFSTRSSTALVSAPRFATAGSNSSSARWLTTNAASSSSSSSSSTTSRFLVGLLGLGAAVGIVTVAQSQEVAHAESAPVAVAPDPLDAILSAAAPTTSAGSSSSPATSEPTKKKKKKKSTKRASKRPTLEYPGKLAKMHREAEGTANVQASEGGFMAQLQVNPFAHDPHMAKQVILIPMFGFGGPNGQQLMMSMVTALGRAHHLEAYFDKEFNSQGHYKYTSERGFSIKPSWSMSAHGNGCELAGDYKGAESATTAKVNINPGGLEMSTSYTQSLTKHLVAGVELSHQLGYITTLNGGAKYTTEDGRDMLAVTKKGGLYQASYTRMLAQHPNPMSNPMMPMPPVTTQFGAVVAFQPSSGDSQLTLGLKHTRPTYTYHIGTQMASSSGGPTVLMAYDTQLFEGAPQFRVGLSSAVKYDGSGEATLGASFMGQF